MLAAKATIPIVFGLAADPVRLRFNLPQPGVSIIRAAPQRAHHSAVEEQHMQLKDAAGCKFFC
jgi:hypothetical protein